MPTSLTVEEASKVLERLACEGHLQHYLYSLDCR